MCIIILISIYYILLWAVIGGIHTILGLLLTLRVKDFIFPNWKLCLKSTIEKMSILTSKSSPSSIGINNWRGKALTNESSIIMGKELLLKRKKEWIEKWLMHAIRILIQSTSTHRCPPKRSKSQKNFKR